jgi:hypothetical protein
MRTSRFLSVVVMASLMMLCGCQGIAYIAASLAPPKKVKPIKELPKDKTILVYIESEYPLSYEPIKDMLTNELNKELLAHKIAGAVVSRDRLLDVMATITDSTVSKQEIGQKLHADLVLCVSVEDFAVRENENTPLWAGKMKVNVKVIDVRKVKKFWPLDQMEYPVRLVELPEVDNDSSTYGNIVAKALAIKTADRIAKLFYEYEVPDNPGGDHKDD